MNKHSAYEKMTNNLMKLGLSEGEYAKLDKLKWVVTEKVHGANFSLIFEENRIKYAKRKEYLSWDDDFFGFQLVVKRYEDKIIRLFEELSLDINASKYIIYGELFGGSYPHSEVKKNQDLFAIQTGVYYTPDVEFYAFDIAIETDSDSRKLYLPFIQSESYFKKYDLIFAKPLYKGKLNDAVNFDIRINSFLPQELQLPALTDNIIEGIVIKPYDLPLENEFKSRPIIKLKNPEFEEEKKFHEAKKWSFIPDVNTKTEELSFITDELGRYINQNRLESAISKVGSLDMNSQERINEIEEEFFNDVITDFEEDNGNLLGDLNKEQKNWIEKRIRNHIIQIIKSYE